MQVSKKQLSLLQKSHFFCKFTVFFSFIGLTPPAWFDQVWKEEVGGTFIKTFCSVAEKNFSCFFNLARFNAWLEQINQFFRLFFSLSVSDDRSADNSAKLKMQHKRWKFLITITRGQFHQHFTHSFYARRSQKRKKTVNLSCFLRFQDLRTLKLRVNTLVKLTPERPILANNRQRSNPGCHKSNSIQVVPYFSRGVEILL